MQGTAAIRVASAYKTVSKSAIQVISDVIPIGLQASERKRVWETKNVHGEAVKVDDARKRTIQHWQEKRNTETSGRYTAKFIPDIIRRSLLNSVLAC